MPAPAPGFMPILRTFAPVVAGVGKMNYRSFLVFNIVGGVSWVFSMVLAGYFLPSLFNPILSGAFGREIHVEKHIEKIVIIVVLLSVSPILYAWVKSKLRKDRESSDGSREPGNRQEPAFTK